VSATPEGTYELFDYVISLREGIMDAWGGIIGAMKSSGKSKAPQISHIRSCSSADCGQTAQVLQPYVTNIFTLLNSIANDTNRSEPLMRASMGVIG
jgi:importin subunit beta-1